MLRRSPGASSGSTTRTRPSAASMVPSTLPRSCAESAAEVRSRTTRRPTRAFSESGVGIFLSGRPGTIRRPQLWESCALPTELLPRTSSILRVRGDPPGPSEVLCGPSAVVVCAANVALRHLSDERPRVAALDKRCDGCGLRPRIAMIEIEQDRIGFAVIDARVRSEVVRKQAAAGLKRALAAPTRALQVRAAVALIMSAA